LRYFGYFFVDFIVKETKIQSKKLKMCVISQDKETLSNNDDKRVWIGHWPSQDIGNTLALTL